jgi:O-antigen ligase
VLTAVGAIALLYGGYALWQYAARDLILNDELLDANQLHLYFRVNSIFKDPNVLGRNLALVIVALAAFVAWARGDRRAWVAAVAAVLLLVALMVTFSITSVAALLTGLVAVAWLRFGARWGLAAAAGCLLTAIALAAVGPAEDGLGSSGIDEATSGRAGLVEGGVDLAEERPAGGWGSGSFGAAFETEVGPARTTISHAEPITVAAEQGAIGVAVYGGLVVASLLVLFGGGTGASVGRTAVAGCYAALLAHSLGYAGFAIDPATWALLGLGLGLARNDAALAMSSG